MLNVKGCNSLLGVEARDALGTVPSGIHSTLYLHSVRPPPKHLRFFYNIVFSPSSTPTPLFLSFRIRFPPPFSSYPYTSNFPSLIPMISRAGCSHHRLDRRIPGIRLAANHKFMVVRVTMYCATAFWWREIYIPISSSPTISSAAPMGGYTHVLLG